MFQFLFSLSLVQLSKLILKVFLVLYLELERQNLRDIFNKSILIPSNVFYLWERLTLELTGYSANKCLLLLFLILLHVDKHQDKQMAKFFCLCHFTAPEQLNFRNCVPSTQFPFNKGVGTGRY